MNNWMKRDLLEVLPIRCTDPGDSHEAYHWQCKYKDKVYVGQTIEAAIEQAPFGSAEIMDFSICSDNACGKTYFTVVANNAMNQAFTGIYFKNDGIRLNLSIQDNQHKEWEFFEDCHFVLETSGDEELETLRNAFIGIAAALKRKNKKGSDQ